MSKQYYQDVCRNLLIPLENILLIQKLTGNHRSTSGSAICTVHTNSLTLQYYYYFLSHLNTEPETNELKKTLPLSSSSEEEEEGGGE